MPKGASTRSPASKAKAPATVQAEPRAEAEANVKAEAGNKEVSVEREESPESEGHLKSEGYPVSEPLTAEDGPLVWIDCEMTGLNVKSDVIIEIAAIITKGDLQPVDEGISYVIRTPKAVLDNMNEWCVDMHGRTGLTQDCINSPHTYEEVSKSVLAYIKKWVPEERIGVLAGSSVHADARFLSVGMPDIIDHLHYRIVDVSTVKELWKRWYTKFVVEDTAKRHKELTESKQKDGKIGAAHRALADIRASIGELQGYRDTIFKDPMGYEEEYRERLNL